MSLAIAYNKGMVEKEATKRGAFLSTMGMATSLLIPGPFFLGAVPGIVHDENPVHRGIIGVFRNVIVRCGTCGQFSFPLYEPFATGDG